MNDTENQIEAIGPYKVVRKLGQGGMGEVFLGEDSVCGRTVAIKRIRPDLAKHEVIRQRFIKEAKITASLFHPSIIPVYAISETDNEPYYVMPYVEGETLKALLRETIRREKENLPPHPIGASINTLLRIFQSVCHAVAYCHAKGILHRDLKPENVLVASHNQVLIFDWGLSGYLHEKEPLFPKELLLKPRNNPNLTMPGKVLGTLAYMPPERVDGKPADIHTDIYSLGVILYQLLTLRMPFHRKSIKSYKKTKHFEKVVDALEAAPSRDIPPQLSLIAKKCLAISQEERYKSVEEIIYDLERFSLGLPDWIFSSSLNIEEASDWELQENVLLSKLIPINQCTEIMQWYYLMISKKSFSGNKRLEIELTLNPSSDGVGFLFNIPKSKEREGLEDGYSIWLGSAKNPGIRLCRSRVPILDVPDEYLSENTPHLIEIEKIDQTVSLSIDGHPVLHYIDPLPIVGTHVGVMSQDLDFSLTSFKVSLGSQNATVGCLSVPDAFLTSKNFDEAILEYEKIAKSFSLRSEGREALFRLGIALIEKGKSVKEEKERALLFDRALSTFEGLHAGQSEPLEYLGKSLVYQRQGDLEEELKCLELAIRKFKKHSLAHVIEERIIFRLHECSKNSRIGVYNFALITLCHIPHRLASRETHALIHNLFLYSEKLPLFATPPKFANLGERYRFMAAQIAFLLNKPHILQELSESSDNAAIKETIDLCLKALSSERIEITAPSLVTQISSLLLSSRFEEAKALLEPYAKESLEKPSSPFHFLRGCLLAHELGSSAAKDHFAKCADFAYPPIHALFGFSYTANPKRFQKWQHEAFTYEEHELAKQRALFTHCLDNPLSRTTPSD